MDVLDDAPGAAPRRAPPRRTAGSADVEETAPPRPTRTDSPARRGRGPAGPAMTRAGAPDLPARGAPRRAGRARHVATRSHGVDDPARRTTCGSPSRSRAALESPARTAASSSTPTLTTAIAGDLRRCLRDIEIPIDVDDRARRSCRASTSPTGHAVDATAEPEVARLTDHHELDLEPLVREAISLAEPIAPLCRPDCPGLCSSAASASGPGHVAHDDDDVDPRLAALRGFRVDGEGGDRVDSALGPTAPPRPGHPHVRRSTTRRRRAGRRRRESRKEQHHPMGVPKRKVSHARQGDRRAHLALDAAAARGVPALPPAEARPSRLPELRLLRRPAGPRDQDAKDDEPAS